jgi:hypothetical protein
MIRKVYEVNPMVCPQCGGTMKVIAFLTDYSVVDRIIHHLKLSFVAERPPPPQFVYQEILTAAAAITAGKEYIFIIHKDFWGHDRNPGELGPSQFSTVENVKGNIPDRREADPQDVWSEQIRRCPGNLREEPDRRQNHLKVVPNFSVFSSGVSRDCPAGFLKKE